MKVRELMTTKVRSASADTSLNDIARMMKEEDVGAIPIVEDGRLTGIVTDRDIVVRCIAEGGDPADMTAEEIVASPLRTVSSDTSLDAAVNLMEEEQIRRLPVVEGDQLVGMLSLGDIAVKHPDEKVAGEVLENVSEGVKPTEPAQRRGQGRHQAAQAAVTGPKSAGMGGGGRQEAVEQHAGRRSGGSRHVQPSRGLRAADEDEVDRSIGTGKRKQGIANRSARQEQRRQSKVVPIRGGKIEASPAERTQSSQKRSGSAGAQQSKNSRLSRPSGRRAS